MTFFNKSIFNILIGIWFPALSSCLEAQQLENTDLTTEFSWAKDFAVMPVDEISNWHRINLKKEKMVKIVYEKIEVVVFTELPKGNSHKATWQNGLYHLCHADYDNSAAIPVSNSVKTIKAKQLARKEPSNINFAGENGQSSLVTMANESCFEMFPSLNSGLFITEHTNLINI